MYKVYLNVIKLQVLASLLQFLHLYMHICQKVIEAGPPKKHNHMLCNLHYGEVNLGHSLTVKHNSRCLLTCRESHRFPSISKVTGILTLQVSSRGGHLSGQPLEEVADTRISPTSIKLQHYSTTMNMDLHRKQ